MLHRAVCMQPTWHTLARTRANAHGGRGSGARQALAEGEVAGKAVARHLGFGLLLILILRRAWLSDDAFICLRYVHNFVHGHGLTFNPGERVQGFTDPLWILLLSAIHVIVQQPYVTCMVLSVSCSALAVWCLLKWVAPQPALALLSVAALGLSQAFVDFSTSGLENPLSHLLLIGFLAINLNPERKAEFPQLTWVLVGLIAFNRLDGVVILAPTLVLLAASSGKGRVWKLATVGFVPLMIWLLFAALYYGSPLPNTALAKLNVNIPRPEMMGQGLVYLFSTLHRDPLTAVVLVVGMVVGFSERDPGIKALALGILLHLAYVVWVAGDFMLGRFLSVPFVGAVCLLAIAAKGMIGEEPLSNSRGWAAAALIGALAVLSPHNPLAVSTGEAQIPPSGVADERAWYVAHTGLMQNLRSFAYKKHGWYQAGRRMAEAGPGASTHCNAGLAGLAAGPAIHLVDRAGLTDAFLARLPFVYAADWRTAHYGRALPAGYLESLKSGENRLVDPGLHQYYANVRRVVAGPVLSWRRIRTAYVLNVGGYDHLLPPRDSP